MLLWGRDVLYNFDALVPRFPFAACAPQRVGLLPNAENMEVFAKALPGLPLKDLLVSVAACKGGGGGGGGS